MKLLKIIFGITFSILLVGCGGGGSSIGSNSITGTPSGVSVVNYVKPNHSDHYVMMIETTASKYPDVSYETILFEDSKDPNIMSKSTSRGDYWTVSSISSDGTVLFDTDDYNVTCVQSPFQKIEHYPLSVGKTWNEKFTTICTRGAGITWGNAIEVTGKVEGLEKITVAAGTYNTIKETYTQTSRDLNSGTTGTSTKTCWVDVASGFAVKCEGKSSFGWGLINGSSSSGSSDYFLRKSELIGYKNSTGSKLVKERYSADWDFVMLINGVTDRCTFYLDQSSMSPVLKSYCGNLPFIQISEDGTVKAVSTNEKQYKNLVGKFVDLKSATGTIENLSGRTGTWKMSRRVRFF